MITQKLYKSGNSVAVTIPKQYLKNLNLKEGEEVVVEENDEMIIISRRKEKKRINSSITPEFLKWLSSFNEKYGSALKELAKK